MAEITAQAVNEFRKKTGLGLMECKALLKQADGDMKKAETLAKEQGLKQAELRAGAPPRRAASTFTFITTPSRVRLSSSTVKPISWRGMKSSSSSPGIWRCT